MELPQDGAILLSFLNMKLRDEYDDLGELCDDLELSQEEICEKMARMGFVYHAESNRFVPFSTYPQ